jgi:hypothetical protein
MVVMVLTKYPAMRPPYYVVQRRSREIFTARPAIDSKSTKRQSTHPLQLHVSQKPFRMPIAWERKITGLPRIFPETQNAGVVLGKCSLVREVGSVIRSL